MAEVVLSGDLLKLLQKHEVDEKVGTYLKTHKCLTIVKFAALADSKADVADGICVPAGLDKTERPLCGPVKSAWAEAEVMAQASLVAIKRGKTCDLDDPVDPEVRKQITSDFVSYYHMKLPAHLLGSDTLVGRLVREYERKLPTAFDMRKVKSLAYLAEKPGGQFTITASQSGEVSGSLADAETDTPLTMHMFIYKHKVLLNSMAMAVAPTWEDADWSVLLDYHEWVVLKMFERKKGRTPTVEAIRDADHKMRTKWVEKQRQEQMSTTKAVKLCRTEFADLFSGLHSNLQALDDGGNSSRREAPPAKASRRELPRVEKTSTGAKICRFYNEGKCTYGTRCRLAHMCNVRGCGQEHAACNAHPRV